MFLALESANNPAPCMPLCRRKRRKMKTLPGLGCLQELALKELGWQPGHRSLVVQLAPAEHRPWFFLCFTVCGLMRNQLV